MYNIIINPVAAKSKSLKALKRTEDYLTKKCIPYRVRYSEYAGHSGVIAGELEASGETEIIILGGDGTIYDVVNGVKHPENINFGIIPCGTGNDYASALHLPSAPEENLDIILKGNIIKRDIIEIAGYRSVNVAGSGLDVEVLEGAKKMKLITGKLKYVFSLIKLLFRFDYYKFRIETEDSDEEGEYMLVSVCNGTRIGGGIYVSPHSKTDDGKLELVTVGKMKKSKIPFLFLSFIRGKHDKIKELKIRSCSHIKITSDKPININTDGEIHYGLNEVNCGIKRGVFNLYGEN